MQAEISDLKAELEEERLRLDCEFEAERTKRLVRLATSLQQRMFLSLLQPLCLLLVLVIAPKKSVLPIPLL